MAQKNSAFDGITLVCEDGQQIEAHKVFWRHPAHFHGASEDDQAPSSSYIYEWTEVRRFIGNDRLSLPWRGKYLQRES